jgi:hypothetical protein
MCLYLQKNNHYNIQELILHSCPPALLASITPDTCILYIFACLWIVLGRLVWRRVFAAACLLADGHGELGKNRSRRACLPYGFVPLADVHSHHGPCGQGRILYQLQLAEMASVENAEKLRQAWAHSVMQEWDSWEWCDGGRQKRGPPAARTGRAFSSERLALRHG